MPQSDKHFDFAFGGQILETEGSNFCFERIRTNYSLSVHILLSLWLLFPLFLPQDTVNALSDFLVFGQRLLSLALEINVGLL